MANRVSNEQLDELLEFLGQNPALAKGVGLGVRSKETIERLWTEEATKLNSFGSGSSKTGERWKKYWADLKHKSKSRLARRRRDALGTGGGPSTQEELSEVDKKILAIIGEQAVFGDSEHRVPIFDTMPTTIQSEAIEIYQDTVLIHLESQIPIPTADSRSIRGQTCTFTREVPENVADDNMPEPSVVRSPVGRPRVDRTRVRRNRPGPSNLNNGQSRIDPNWVMEMERARIEAEKKLADAAMVMAEASRVQAEASRVQAEATHMQAQACLTQAESMKTLIEELLSRHREVNTVLNNNTTE